MNLLAETIDAIADSGHEVCQIVFIGSLDSGHQCSWEEFERLADREYDSGYGSAEVATDLVIAFSDQTYMTRGEYDGSEWWEYNKPLSIPEIKKPIKTLFGGMWNDLEKMNESVKD